MKTLILILLLFLVAKTKGEWSYHGIRDLTVNNLVFYHDTIFASTHEGIFKKGANSNDTLWTMAGFEGKNISSLHISVNGDWLVHERDLDESVSMIHIKNKHDNSVNTIFSGEVVYHGFSFFKMVAVSSTHDTIVNLSANQITRNGGDTWTELFQGDVTFRFVDINKQNPLEIWLGGESLILSPVLFYSDDGGENFSYRFDPDAFFPGDNCTHWIVRNGDTWFIPGEGVVGRTMDAGYTWENLLTTWFTPDKSLYFFDMAMSPVNPKFLYTTGDGIYPVAERVNLFFSEDEGLNWHHIYHSFGGNFEYDITNMLVLDQEGRDKIFFGGRGVYSYLKDNPTSISYDNNNPFAFKVFPNPFSTLVSMKFSTPAYIKGKLTVYDHTGKKILVRPTTFSEGENTFVLSEFQNLKPGHYYLNFIGDCGLVTGEKLIKL